MPVPSTPSASPAPVTATAPVIDAPMVPDPGLVSIHMIDESNGWGIGDKWIVRTADGGVTWHNVTPSDAASFGYAVTATFPDAVHGWVLVPNPDDMLNGILYRTVDGGLTWREAPVPFGGGVLRFVDFRQGWMLASLGAGAGSMAVSVFQTGDSGASWQLNYTNDPAQPGAGDSLPLSGLKDGLSPLTMQRAWIGGVVYTPGSLYLYETKDAGRTWAASRAPVPEGYEQAELETTGPVFVSPTVGYMPLHLSSQNGVVMAVYDTRDGGATWSLTPSFIPQGGSMDFVSEQTGFVWNGTAFYVTNDGARTWFNVTPDVDFSDAFTDMDFVNPKVGFVLVDDGNGTRGIFKTMDGAATWNMLDH